MESSALIGKLRCLFFVFPIIVSRFFNKVMKMQFITRYDKQCIHVEHSVYNRKVVSAYISPRATEKQNRWLGFWLRVVYNIYFWLVSMDNCLVFFKEKGDGEHGKD